MDGWGSRWASAPGGLRGALLLGALALVLLLPASLAAAPPDRRAPSAPLDAPSASLAAAIQSLARADPAGTGPGLACASSGPYGAICSGSSAVPSSASLGPGWVEPNISRAPTPRVDAQMVYDASDGYVLLYGGSNESTAPPVCQDGCARSDSDTWTYLAGTWTELPIPGPSPRSGESMVYDATDGVVLLFGGELDCGNVSCPISGDTWSYHHGAWKELAIGGPPARLDAPIAYDARDGYVLLFGGILASGLVANDSWTFEDGGWSQQLIAGPPPDAYQESMTYDGADGYVLLVGSGSPGLSGLLPNVTWTYENGVWSERPTATSPPFLWGAWVAYDPAVGYVVLAGEQVDPQYGPLYNVTWGYLGGAWFPVDTVNPSLRLGLSPLVYDPPDGYLVAFGGEQWSNGSLAGGLLNDTWNFVAPALGFGMSVSSDPPGICAVNAGPCPAGTNVTRVTLHLESIYVSGAPIPGFSYPLVMSPTFTFVPYGPVSVFSNLAELDPTSSCYDPYGFTDDCDTNTSVVAIAPGVLGLRWDLSRDPFRDQLLARSTWTASFNVYATAPPFGTVSVDDCVTAACSGLGSGELNGSFTSISFRAFENATVSTVSFPPGLLSIEPPSGPPSQPQPSLLPPVSPAMPVSPPPTPAVVPPGAPASSPVPPGAGPGILAIAPIGSGAIAAGFTQVKQKRKVATAVAAPSGALSGSAPSGRGRRRGRGPGGGNRPPPARSRFEAP
ncbi:MAG: hypothetical protein ACREC5_00905 [Thermoplasmata archaeon]